MSRKRRDGWTVDTLKDLFDHRIDELKEQFERAIADRDVRVNLALTAARDAVAKAETANERRLDLLNEFRAQLGDDAAKYARSELVQQRFDEIFGRLGRTENTLSSIEGRYIAIAGGATLFGGFVGAMIVKFLT